MRNNRSLWLICLSTVLFLVAAGVTLRAMSASAATPTHPPASAPEETATIVDDPTTAPDPSQSADNNVSFPTDI